MFQGVHPIEYHQSQNYAPCSACKTPANVLIRIELIHTKVYEHFLIVTTIAYIELKHSHTYPVQRLWPVQWYPSPPALLHIHAEVSAHLSTCISDILVFIL